MPRVLPSLLAVLLVAGCAFGLYLGRSDLFSWTVLTDPAEVRDVVAAVGRGAGLTGIVLAFVVLLAGYAGAVGLLGFLGLLRPRPGSTTASGGTTSGGDRNLRALRPPARPSPSDPGRGGADPLQERRSMPDRLRPGPRGADASSDSGGCGW